MLSPTDAVNLEAKTSNSNEIETVNGVNGDVNGTSTEEPKPPNKKSNEEEINGNANDIFEEIVSEEEAKRCTLEELMKTMLIRQYNSNSPDHSLINLKCKILFEKDYTVEVVENTFTSHYPKNIIVPVGKVEIKVDKESEKKKSKDLVKQDLMEFDKDTYSQLAKDSLLARLRSRFVAPVILFDNKFICRSGTLTVWTSALYERCKSKMSLEAFSEMVRSGISTVVDVAINPARIPDAVYELWDAAWENVKLITRYNDLSEIYAKDVKVLEYLKIERIFDLMIEYRKHYRNAVDVSSTEKVNDLYKRFKVEEMPYPDYVNTGATLASVLSRYLTSDLT